MSKSNVTVLLSISESVSVGVLCGCVSDRETELLSVTVTVGVALFSVSVCDWDDEPLGDCVNSAVACEGVGEGVPDDPLEIVGD
jgi:hypothetical protein